VVVLGMTNSTNTAGPWEDGIAAYNRGDYVPAIQVFRGMAKAGNARPKAYWARCIGAGRV